MRDSHTHPNILPPFQIVSADTPTGPYCTDSLDDWPSHLSLPESIEWFLEAQAFFRSRDSAPRPSSPPPSPVNKLSLFLNLPVSRRSSLLTRGGEGVGEEPNYTTARKPGSLLRIQYSLVSSISSKEILADCDGADWRGELHAKAGPKDEREARPKFPPPDSIFNWKSVGALPADLYLSTAYLSISISLSPSPVIIMYVLGCQSSQLMLQGCI